MPKFKIDKFIAEEQDPSKAIGELTNGRLTPQPDSETLIKQITPKLHDVMDKAKRPDKLVNVDPSSSEYGSTRSIMVNQEESMPEKCRIEHVNRIAIGWQKLIVKRAVGITFGNPVKYKAQPEGAAEKALYEAVQRVLKDNKEAPLNRRAARHIYGLTEVAERWYTTESQEPHTNYSKNGTTFHIRVVTFSPKFGDVLYPYFNDDRDMEAFSRKFSRKDSDGKERCYFETYTAENFYMWCCESTATASTDAQGWKMVEGYPKKNPYGKIPIIYGCQEEPEFEDVNPLVDRMEKLLSNFGDTNDYHASPKIVVKGHVNSFCKKGEAGAVLELDPDASADYLVWNQAPQSVKDEYDILKELIHTISQTPDISWNAVKGLSVSGLALQLMFMDSVLKVKDKEEIWLDFLTRRVNLIKTMLYSIDKATFKDAAKTLCIDPEIVPFVTTDEQGNINVALAASGNKQLASRRTAIQRIGWTDDVDQEMKDIEEEEEREDYFNQGEPTV